MDTRTPDVVVVGAGPVGLWTALQLKLRRPEWRVLVYERSTQYVRSHVLRLDHWSLMLYGRHKSGPLDPIRNSLYMAIVGKQVRQLAMQPASSLFIRTNELEKALRGHALQAGVEIVYRKGQTAQEVQSWHHGCTRFIAADGARSLMRDSLLGPSGLVERTLRHVVEVKYETRGDGKRLGVFSEQLKANRKLNFMAFEYVGKAKDGVAPVTLRFFVDTKTYAQLGEASFKEPLSVDHERVPAALKEDVLHYMRFRAGEGQEAVCRQSAKLTKLTLSMYHAKHFAISQGDACWFLVGDAAMGVPYFRALNSGLILGSRLAQLLYAKSWPVREKLSRQKALYLLHQAMHWRTEFAIARGKDSLLSGYDWARQLAGGVVSAREEDPSAVGGELEQEHLLEIDCRKDS